MAAGIDIAILIPVHAATPDHLVWLEEAVQSVGGQSYPHKKIMIADDASPYPVEPKRFAGCTVFRHSSRHGVCHTRNLLGDRCDTDWLIWLDADDKLYDGALAKMVHGARPDRVVFGNLMVFGEGYAARYYALKDYDGCLLLEEPIMPVTSLHTKAAFEAIRGFDPAFEEGLEDWDYNIRLMLAGYCGVQIKEPLMWYRRHPTQRSKGAHWLRRMSLRIQEKYNGAGGDNMPCCGGGGRRRANPGNPHNARALSNINLQSGEMILVRYTGNKMGAFTIRGKATRQRYRFGGNDRERWVWPQDVRELVRLPEFRIIPRQPPTPQPDVVLLEQEVIAPVIAPISLSGGRPTPPDDLTEIKGLGPARQTSLNEIGMTRFEELAVADLEVVAQTAKVSLAIAAEWIKAAREKL